MGRVVHTPRHRRLPERAVLAPPLLWGAWMVAYGIAWPPELWAGVLGMASLSGLGLSILALPPAVPEPAWKSISKA